MRIIPATLFNLLSWLLIYKLTWQREETNVNILCAVKFSKDPRHLAASWLAFAHVHVQHGVSSAPFPWEPAGQEGLCPQARRGSIGGAGVGVGMLRGVGDSLT